MGRTGSRTSILAYCLAIFALVLTGIWFAVGSAAEPVSAAANTGSGTTFPGTGTGSIPDGASPCPTYGAARDVTFNVTGISGPISDIQLDAGLTHSWVGDLEVTLIAPDMTSHVIFARVGSSSVSCFGDSSDLAGTYMFSDAGGPTNFWSAATGTTGPVPAGSYRTIASGPTDSPPAAVTDFTAAFAGVANPNGTWTLRVRDGAGGDTGSVSAASLTLTGGVAPTGSTFVDFDGDGKSDPSVGRNTSPTLAGMPLFKSYRERLEAMKNADTNDDTPAATGAPAPGSNLTWYVANSGSGTPGISAFGEPLTDFVAPQDFDGDGKADIVIWRPVAPTGPGGAYFLIFRSSDQTVDTVDFGQEGDNPSVAGDYDGDGSADPAVFRCPTTAGQCFYYYKGSAGGGEITFVPWGFGTNVSVFPAIGDFDGDGKHDFNVQTSAGGGLGLFTLFRSSDSGVEYIQWGLDSDFIAPGDYDGDGKTDIAVGRNNGGVREWWILERDGGTQAAPWGIGTDFMAPADYDGDGKTDVAVWRPSDGTFYIFNSGTGMVSGFKWGQSGDYPIPNFQVQ